MKNFTNDNIINILFFLGLFLAIYLLNIFMGTAIFERIVTNLFIYIILVVGLQIFMGNSGILSFAHIGYMSIGAYCSGIFRQS